MHSPLAYLSNMVRHEHALYGRGARPQLHPCGSRPRTVDRWRSGCPFSLGAEATGVCSTRNVGMVRSIGADYLIDYTREDFTQKDWLYDLILDNVANHSLSDLRRALTPTGTLVPNGGGFDNHWFAGGGRVIGAHVLNGFVLALPPNILRYIRPSGCEEFSEVGQSSCSVLLGVFLVHVLNCLWLRFCQVPPLSHVVYGVK
jgi:zinc-binding alcohol dehydrogenase family protein